MKLSYTFFLVAHALTALALPSPNRGKAASTAASTAAATATAPAAGAEENKDANEVQLTGQFGAKINIGGGNIKTDTLFPPGVSSPLSPPAKDLKAYRSTMLTLLHIFSKTVLSKSRSKTRTPES